MSRKEFPSFFATHLLPIDPKMKEDGYLRPLIGVR
jgi:hypothetical protein